MSQKRLIVILWSVAALLVAAAFFATRTEVVDYRDAYRPEVSKAVVPGQVQASAPAAVVQTLAAASAPKVAPVISKGNAPSVSQTIAAASALRSSAPLLSQIPSAFDQPRPVSPALAKAGYVRAPSASASVRKQAAADSRIPDDRHFAKACSSDHDLHLAAGKPCLYVCSGLRARVGPDTDLFTEVATVPNSETFSLHSRPGARLTIYLDFTGHTTAGTPWNGIPGWQATFTTPPYSIDGDTATFNDEEHALIQTVWRMVSEDFAPFDVDVTTEAPAESALLRSNEGDLQYGVRVVIGPDQNLAATDGAGGIAYIGSFNAYPAVVATPCFVFAELGNSNGKFVAECASHEIGHTVGLFHDGIEGGKRFDGDWRPEYYDGHGSGALSWAPIMGVGYIKNVVQWSKGEYAGATQDQDDLAVIQTYIPLVPDDHGNILSTASVLADNVLEGGGVIARGGDLDLIKFGCGRGDITIASNVYNVSPNLRMQLELLDSSGAVLKTVTAPGTINNMAAPPLTYNITTKGHYYLRVSSLGSGDANTGYTDYASAGRYGLAATFPVYVPDNEPPEADITGTGPAVATLVPENFPHGSQPSITFRGLDSTDPDGVIVGYRWEFGDEQGSVSTDPLTTFSYRKPGVYQARLTVTDNQGGSSSVTLPITVNWPDAAPLPTPASCVATVTADAVRTTNNTFTWGALVRTVDEFGLPVKNAQVTVGWTGAITGSAVVRTDAAGQAYFEAGRFRSSILGNVTFTVLNVKKPEKPYDPARNNEVSDVASR